MTDHQSGQPGGQGRAAAILDRWGTVAIPCTLLFAVFAALLILTSDIGSGPGGAAQVRRAAAPVGDIVRSARGAADDIFLERVAQAGALAAEVAALRQDLQRIERTLRALNLKLVAARLQSAGRATVIAGRAKRISALEKQLAAARTEIAGLRRDAADRQSDVISLRRTVAALRKDLAMLRRALAAAGRIGKTDTKPPSGE